MKEVLILAGLGSIGYGMYLMHKKKAVSQQATMGVLSTTGTGTAPASVTTGPTINSSAGPVNNSLSPVEHYNTSERFPPITYIQIPGAGSLDNMDTTNMHAVVQF